METTMSSSDPLKIAVIYGSVRKARQGIKAARFVINKVGQRGHEATLIDALEYPLPLLDKMYKEFEDGAAPALRAYRVPYRYPRFTLHSITMATRLTRHMKNG
jgi:hypothetical protein